VLSCVSLGVIQEIARNRFYKGVFMKNTIKVCGIIAMAVVIGFAIITCSSPTGGGVGYRPAA